MKINKNIIHISVAACTVAFLLFCFLFFYTTATITHDRELDDTNHAQYAYEDERVSDISRDSFIHYENFLASIKEDGQSLIDAIFNSNYDEVYNLLENHPDIVNYQDAEGSSPLFYAVAFGHNEIAELLLYHGANPNAPDHDNNTPLHAAVDYNQYGLAKLLMSYEADPLIQNLKGESPLDRVENRKMELILLKD